MSDLDQLDHIAAQADEGAAIADNMGAPEGEAIATGPDYQQQAMAGLDLFCSMVAGYAPETAQVFTPECKTRIAAAAVPVMEKYQFTFDKVPPELVLLAVAGPPVYQAARMVATRMEKDRAPKAQEAQKVQATTPAFIDASKMPADKPEPAPRHPQEALYK